MRFWRKPFASREAAQLDRMQLAMDYRATFATPAGQRVLADLLHVTGVGRNSFRPGQADVTAFNEGQRRIGLHLIELINADPDALAQLLATGDTEALNERHE